MAISELFHASKRFLADFEWLSVSKYFDKLDSTQKRILQFLPDNEDTAALLMAESQSKGVGRLGREWISPEGGIWMTLALPMKSRELSQVTSFSVVCSHLIVDSLLEINNLECQMKWPNDVLYKGKKIAGIIINTITKKKKKWFLLGIGINVNNDLPGDLAKNATSIKKIRNQTQGRSRLIESLLGGIWVAWQDYDRTGFGPYQQSVSKQLFGVGKPVDIMVGSEKMGGTVIGIDTEGGLSLKSNGEVKTIRTGEIVD